MSPESLHDLIAGYGLPLPGETALVSAAVYAGSTGNLSLAAVIATAAAAAIIGDNLGYLAGRRFGRALVTRFGPRIGMTPPRWRLARYLVERYGVYAVFAGRFVAILRSLAAAVAGAAQMPWLRFFIANALGGIAWASVYGLAAHSVGEVLHRLSHTELVLLAGGALAVFLLTGQAIARRRGDWQREADRLYGAGDAS
jgi:membrane protein DedA with SNARE-associated domain